MVRNLVAKEIDIGIIGGSGFYNLINIANTTTLRVKTAFGSVDVIKGNLGGKKIGFITRHGPKHTKPPHKVNYHANALALFLLGAKYVIATNAVGSLKKEFPPGSIIIVDQIIDFTKNRKTTFFDGEFELTMPDGRVKKGVVHTDVTEPYCSYLRKKIIESAEKLKLSVFPRGTYICTEGPRFETPAEIRMFRILGGDIVGMTGCPEASLARELGICYASLCLISNMAAGLQSRITSKEVSEVASEKRGVILDTLKDVLKRMPRDRSCGCSLQKGAEFKV